MTAISMPEGKPGEGTVFFVYRAKVDTGSSIAHRWRNHRRAAPGNCALILQGHEAYYEGEPCTS